MEKFGVVTTDNHTKVGDASGKGACPSCGSDSVVWDGTVPFCRNCGTEPWEPHGSQKKDRSKEDSNRR